MGEIPMLLLQSQITFRVPMLLLAATLAAFSMWMLLSELPRSGVQRLPTNFDTAAMAASARARASWAAAFGGVRGDLWAESAFTYATLLSPGPAPDADSSIVANQARTVIERALRCAPYEASVWLLAARLAFRFNWTNANPVAFLKMSFYTGPNERHLIPLRLLTATHSKALGDNDLRQLVQRDVRMILTQWPELKGTLAAAYKGAKADAKQFLQEEVTETDPGFLEAMRAPI
jgi:hypothetical protein